MMWCDFERNKQTAETWAWNMCLKEGLFMLFYFDKIDTFYQRISRILFKICFLRVACTASQPNRHILEILLASRHNLVMQNCQRSVRLHHWSISGWAKYELKILSRTHQKEEGAIIVSLSLRYWKLSFTHYPWEF